MDRRTMPIVIAAGVVVIAVVAVIGYYVLTSASGSDDSRRMSDMQNLRDALAKFYQDNKSFPATPSSSQCSGSYNNVVNLAASLVPKYIANIPSDPKPRACEYNYLYQVTPDNQGYAVLVNLENIDPALYNDHWCIGSFSGNLPPIAAAYHPCPSP